jgi:hypothetical protein
VWVKNLIKEKYQNVASTSTAAAAAAVASSSHKHYYYGRKMCSVHSLTVRLDTAWRIIKNFFMNLSLFKQWRIYVMLI